MSDECLELKNIKYKSMLLTGNTEEIQETVENLSNLDQFLIDEKKINNSEPWSKLNKTDKINKIKGFCDDYASEHKLNDSDKEILLDFLLDNLDRKKLLKTKEVNYNKETGVITSIPALIYNSNNTKKFTLKRCDKRQSTLKSLAPKKNKPKKQEKIDIKNI